MSEFARTTPRAPLRFWLTAVLVCLASALLMGLAIHYLVRLEQDHRLRQFEAVAAVHALGVQTFLERAFGVTHTLAAVVRYSGGEIDDFEHFAADLVPQFPGISVLGLSPAGRIRYIWPLQGHEGDLGQDLFLHPQKAEDAWFAVRNLSLTLTGRFDLPDGSPAIAARLPVFVSDELGHERLWGLVHGVVRLEQIARIPELVSLLESGQHYRIWRLNPHNGEREILLESRPEPFALQVNTVMDLPNSRWDLSVEYNEDPLETLRISLMLVMGVMLSLLLGYLSWLLLSLRWHRLNLEAQVEQRTRQIRAAEDQARSALGRYQSFISASNTGAWEYDWKTRQLRCSPEFFSMLGYDPDDFPPERQQLGLWIELLHPQDRERAVQCFASYLEEQPDHLYQNQFRLRNAAQDWTWILSRGSLLRDEQGQPKGLIVGTHIDISDNMRAAEELRLAARVFEQSSDGFLITDAERRVVMVNHGFTRITGYQADEIIGQKPELLASGLHDQSFHQALWEHVEHDGQWQGEIWHRRKDGSLYPEWLSVSRMQDEDGQTSHYVAIFSDISQRKEDEEQIHRLAYYDPLTGLPNRALLEERGRLALSMAERHGGRLALLFIDLDNFKNINDSLGHAVGDALLVAFAERLGQELREEDTLSRTGGDEFILILPEVDANTAVHGAQRILDLLRQPLSVAGYELTVSASIGIALYPDDADTLAGLHTNADIAMYRAKQQGRNGYSFYTPELQSHYVRTLKLENALRRALEQDQLSLHFQPQHELLSGRLVGAEALLRWKHPELGWVPPAEFVPIAESSGLIGPIGDWVLGQALRQLRSWQAQGYTELCIAVNLSAAQFRAANLPERVAERLERAGVSAASLELELTESITMQDPETAVLAMERLHQLGVRVALDDFGTGYSSLSYLKRFRLHKLKIDQSFVHDLERDDDDATIVRSTISLATSLGLQVLAEGVETQAQHDFLLRAGCQFAQGYLYSRPLPADEFSRYAARCMSIELP